jgi:TolB-like protein/cytochrome c-type biogenesis protein CcmH/NrfG
MADQKQPPLYRLRTTVGEYVTHWFVAGVIVTATGFAPDHWVAHVLEAIPAGFRRAFPSGIDYRLVVVCLGVSIIALDILSRYGKHSKATVPEMMPGATSPQSHQELPPATSDDTHPRPVSVNQITSSERPSIAVLPFANLSNDPEQAYFAEGLTASLTTDLSRISDLFVIASTTAAIFGGKTVDVRQLGRDLGVRYVLQGSVQRGGDKVRMNVHLVDASSGVQLWSDRFDGVEADLFMLQDQITGRIAISVQRKIIAIAARDSQQRTDNPQVIDLLVRAIATADSRMALDNLVEQEVLFRRVLALDPTNADAWAWLARAILLQRLPVRGSLPSEQRNEKLEEARKAVEEALALNPNSAVAHVAECLLYRQLHRPFDEARAAQAAIALDRNSVRAHSYLGRAWIHLGEPEKAIPCIEQAMRLDPLGPAIGIHQSQMGTAHFLLKHSDLAVEWMVKARSSLPNHFFIYVYLAAAYAQKGNDTAARLAVENLLRLAPTFELSKTPDAPGPLHPEAAHKLYNEVVLPAATRAGIPI